MQLSLQILKLAVASHFSELRCWALVLEIKQLTNLGLKEACRLTERGKRLLSL